MGPDLLRQRRNLLVVSVTLICVNLAGAEFNKLAVMGTEITFSRRWVLVAGAWVLWGYFLLRYYQYLREVPNLGISAMVINKMVTLERKDAGAWKLQNSPSPGSNSTIVYCGFLRWKSIDAEFAFGTYATQQQRGVHLQLVQGIYWFIRAFVSVTILTPRMTDYALPIVVAAAAPISAGIAAFWL